MGFCEGGDHVRAFGLVGMGYEFGGKVVDLGRLRRREG